MIRPFACAACALLLAGCWDTTQPFPESARAAPPVLGNYREAYPAAGEGVRYRLTRDGDGARLHRWENSDWVHDDTLAFVELRPGYFMAQTMFGEDNRADVVLLRVENGGARVTEYRPACTRELTKSDDVWTDTGDYGEPGETCHFEDFAVLRREAARLAGEIARGDTGNSGAGTVYSRY